jgi:putative hemolysin
MEPNDSIGSLLLLVLLIALQGLLSTLYYAFTNAHKAQLREMADSGNQKAARALVIAEDASRLIITQQLLSLLLGFASAGVLTLTIGQRLVRALLANNLPADLAATLGYGGTWLAGGIFTLFITNLISAGLGNNRADALALTFVGLMNLILKIFGPIAALLNRLTNQIAGRRQTLLVTEEEIKTLVDAGSEGGAIEDEEKEMIYSIFQFSDMVAREMMVPRIDMVAIDADTTLSEALATIVSKGHSRIPVYEETIDKIVGILYAKDMLAAWRDGRDKNRLVRDLIRAAYFVPESKSAGSLLAELQKRRVHLAVVIDEYGGTAGMITIEDLLEEIVGEIQDEFDTEEEAEVVKINDDEYLFDGGISLSEVNALVDLDLSTDESDTLGGYILSVLGRVPEAGDHFEEEEAKFVVEAMNGRRIRRVRLVHLKATTEKADEKPEADSPSVEAATEPPATDLLPAVEEKPAQPLANSKE